MITEDDLKALDDQHTQLLNEIVRLRSLESPSFIVDANFIKAFDTLCDDIKNHMVYEERIMKESDYFDLNDHYCAHKAYIRLVYNIKENARLKPETIFHGLKMMYGNIKAHVEIEDIFLGGHLKDYIEKLGAAKTNT